ncbi:unnamed protein product [Cyprideis torosa]|uniref:RFX1-4/6/8-like BCD domain-containing protein n=1 Tax=Cyprideis torosa TaxID=163714 RepID=A0A7R8WV01_9CRUS|nr:unnamed protein product [Cyprideis torosa]CAG0910647.1 unnamed protein product [Cyprideis torosa]
MFWKQSHEDAQLAGLDSLTPLPREKFYRICSNPTVQEFVRSADCYFYQHLISILVPNVLKPISSSLTQSVRNFAKGLEEWMASAVDIPGDIPREMVKVKISTVCALAQALRRYTSLNHLAQAARAVLCNEAQIQQMLADINRVDFRNVQEQASWVCDCDEDSVAPVKESFMSTLEQQKTLEQWADWLTGVVDRALEPFKGTPDFPKAAKKLLLKWSFYR